MTERYLIPALLAAALAAAAPAPAAEPATVPADAATTSLELNDPLFHQLPPEERRRRQTAGYVARFEPSGNPTVDRLPAYVARYVELNIYDPRYTVCRVEASHEAGTTGTVNLSGEVLLPQYRSGVEGTMRDLGFNVGRNDIVVLPDLPDGTHPYGVATTTAATLRRYPHGAAEQVNSVPMGGWVRLLRDARPDDTPAEAAGPGRGARGRGRRAAQADAKDRWFLAQSPEGYVGFVPSGDHRPADEGFEPDGMLMAPVSVRVDDRDVTVPLGAWLRRGGSGAWTVAQPGGDVELPAGAVVAPAQASVHVDADEILRIAAPLMATGYEWGGTTERGIDCSGFTQFVFKSRGVFLPRDAEQQSIVGNLVAFGGEVARKAQPGDVVFFVNERGRVNHVGLSLGGDRVIHSNSSHGVHVGRLLEPEEGAREPLINRTVFARRVSF